MSYWQTTWLHRPTERTQVFGENRERETFIEATPHKYVFVHKELGNIIIKVSVSNVYMLLRYGLKLTPFIILIRQHLKSVILILK